VNVAPHIESMDRLISFQTQIRELKDLLRFEREWAVEKIGLGKIGSVARIPGGKAAGNPKFQRVLAAMKILRNIDGATAYWAGERSFSSSPGHLTPQDYIKHDLLYFIAVTDSSEDTFGHSQFVAAYSLLLARAAGIEDMRHLADIDHGALLHDIGKIAIPDAILRKPGSLTALEREIVGEHPVVGYEIIRDFDFLKKPAEIVLNHHERFDGRGYPCGLAGDDIPLEARIFSIADTIDAITSDRPYRRSRSFAAAFREVMECSGSQFDPAVVDVMRSIPDERWLQVKMATLARLAPPVVH